LIPVLVYATLSWKANKGDLAAGISGFEPQAAMPYIIGDTSFSNIFPTASDLFARKPQPVQNDVFVTKLNPPASGVILTQPTSGRRNDDCRRYRAGTDGTKRGFSPAKLHSSKFSHKEFGLYPGKFAGF